MQLHVRPFFVLFIFALLACGDDREPSKETSDPRDDDAPSDEGIDGERADVPEPAMTPACEALVGAGETVYESPRFFAAVHDARASADGYVVLLLSEKEAADAPLTSVLRLVRTPQGADDVVLPTEDAVLAMSEIVAGKLLVLQGGAELFGAVRVSQIDLAARSVVTSRVLEDLSGLGRPVYDALGMPSGQSTGSALTLARHGEALAASQIAQLADGGYAVLGFVSDPLPTQGQAIGLWLYVYEADGRFRARTEIKPMLSGFLGRVQLAPGAGGQLHVLTTLHASERAAFERIHGRALQTAAFETLPLVLSFSSAGALIGVREPDLASCAAPIDATAGTLDVVDETVTWTGGCDGGVRAWIASGVSAEVPASTTPVTLAPAQSVSSVLRDASGALFVAGTRNFTEGAAGSLEGPGDAVLARIDASGAFDPVCPYDTEGHDSYLLRRTGKPLLVLNYDAGLTQAAGDLARGSARVRYFVPPSNL